MRKFNLDDKVQLKKAGRVNSGQSGVEQRLTVDDLDDTTKRMIINMQAKTLICLGMNKVLISDKFKLELAQQYIKGKGSRFTIL